VASASSPATPLASAHVPASSQKGKARARKGAVAPAPAPVVVAPTTIKPATAAPPAALGSHRRQPSAVKPSRGKGGLPSWALPICYELVAYTTDRVGILQNPWDYKKHVRVIIRDAIAAVAPGVSPTDASDPEVFNWVSRHGLHRGFF
jgi:hypothetical protein